MLEYLIKNFLYFGDRKYLVQILNYCEKNNLYEISGIFMNFINYFFPNNIELLLLMLKLLEKIPNENKYRQMFDIIEKIEKLQGISENDNIFIRDKKSEIIKYIQEDFAYYNIEKVKYLTDKSPNKIKLVTVTMTTCKRFSLFEKTINSLINCLEDIDMVDSWFCVDDNSSDEDRIKMKELYPFFEFYFKTPEEKGHAKSLNIILEKVTTPYIFHLEDDWLFFNKKQYISECLNVLVENETIGQCLLNKNYGETMPDLNRIYGGKNVSTSNYTKYILHENPQTEEEKKDFYTRFDSKATCGYWPHFSLRPSLIKKHILNYIGNFNIDNDGFEMLYSQEYRKNGFLSIFLDNINCIHIGRLTSERNNIMKLNAYDLNKESQFGRKLKSKTYLINLDRRQDRLENFIKENPNIKFDRFSAIDGTKLKPNYQLQRIFDNHDLLIEGMAGCSLSHLQIYIELINSDYDFFVIFEDDAKVVDNFDEKLITIYNSIKNIAWDIIFLGHHPRDNTDEHKDSNNIVLKQYKAFQSLSNSLGGNFGYIINKQGAQKLLEFINRVGMINSIDTMIQKSCDILNVFYSEPQIIFSNCVRPGKPVDSDIQFNHRKLNMDFQKRLSDERKFYLKFYDNIVDDLKFPDALKFVKDPNSNGVIFYYFENIPKLYEECIHSCYIIDTVCLVIIANPKESLKQCTYLEPLKKHGKFNIDDAIIYN